MAAPADCEVEAFDSGARPDDRVPVGGHVVRAREAAHELEAGQRRIPRPQAAADGVLVAARKVVVTVVGPLEEILTGVGHGAELAPPVGSDDDVRHRVRAHRGRKRAAGRGASHEHLQPAELDRLVGAQRPQQVVRPRPGGQDDLTGRDEAVWSLEADGAAGFHADGADGPAEVVPEAAARRRREPAQAHLLRVGEPAVRLVRRACDSHQRQLGLDLMDLARLEEAGVEVEGPEHRDVAPTGVGQLGWHREQVAAGHESRVGDADLVVPVPDRARAGDGEAGGDLVRVVPAHHRERPA